jgi:hypothetical protein
MSAGTVVTFDMGSCLLQVWPEGRYCQSVFPDATTVPAAPQDNESYRNMARELGYGEDTWRMCVEHELLHTMLAQMDGRPYSPTLFAVAHGVVDSLEPILVAEEEAAVLEFQRRLNACRSNAPVADVGKP